MTTRAPSLRRLHCPLHLALIVPSRIACSIKTSLLALLCTRSTVPTPAWRTLDSESITQEQTCQSRRHQPCIEKVCSAVCTLTSCVKKSCTCATAPARARKKERARERPTERACFSTRSPGPASYPRRALWAALTQHRCVLPGTWGGGLMAVVGEQVLPQEVLRVLIAPRPTALAAGQPGQVGADCQRKQKQSPPHRRHPPHYVMQVLRAAVEERKLQSTPSSCRSSADGQ